MITKFSQNLNRDYYRRPLAGQSLLFLTFLFHSPPPNTPPPHLASGSDPSPFALPAIGPLPFHTSPPPFHPSPPLIDPSPPPFTFAPHPSLHPSLPPY